MAGRREGQRHRVDRRRRGDARRAALAIGQSDSVIVTDSMTTFSFGVPAPGDPMASMASTTSRPFTTLPNSEYCGGSCTPDWPLMTKNWLPLVLGPALAIAN